MVNHKSLAEERPDLLKEWDYEKNNELGIFPDKVTCRAGKKVWWKCSKGHSYFTLISSRTGGRESGCPICSNRVVLKGFNDLSTLFPNVASEWDYDLNKNVVPDMVTFSSGKKYWWKCSKCGNSWKQSVYSRCKKGQGCSVCKNLVIVTGYNDLATINPVLASEWDYEKNGDLLPTMVGVNSGKKVYWKCSFGHSFEAVIATRNNQQTGCPYCANKKVLKGFNDLASQYPYIAKSWDYEKNGNITPEMVVYGSGKLYWWKCDKCGSSWKTAIRIRVRGFGCPKCAHDNLGEYNSKLKLIKGVNDFGTLYPEIASEWDYEKNLGLTPFDVIPGSNKRVWWKCSKGHEWQTTVVARTARGSGCPKCCSAGTSFPEQAIYYFLDMFFHDEIENRYKLKDKKGYIEADIYLLKQNIVIEYDGKYWHKDKQEKDLEKECRIKAMGIRFIRIAEHNRNKVIENCILYDFRKNQEENLTWVIRELFIMLDISPLFVNVSAFRDKILEFSRKNEVNNSLAVVYPEIADEWNYEKMEP